MDKSNLSVVPQSEQPVARQSEQPVAPQSEQPAGTTSSDPDALNVPNAPNTPQGISSDILTTISETAPQYKSEEEECKQLNPAIAIKKILQNQNIVAVLKENNIYDLIHQNILSEAIPSDYVNIKQKRSVCKKIVDKDECLKNGCQFNENTQKCSLNFRHQNVSVHKSKILDNKLIEIKDDCSIQHDIIINPSMISDNDLTKVKDKLSNLINQDHDPQDLLKLKELYEVVSKQICLPMKYYDCKKDKCMDVKYIAIEKIKDHPKCTFTEDVNLDDNDFETLQKNIIAKNNDQNCDKYSDTDCENSNDKCKLITYGNNNTKKCISNTCEVRGRSMCEVDGKCKKYTDKIYGIEKCRKIKCEDYNGNQSKCDGRLSCTYNNDDTCSLKSCKQRTLDNCKNESDTGSNKCMTFKGKCINTLGIRKEDINILKSDNQSKIDMICNNYHLHNKDGKSKDLIDYLNTGLNNYNLAVKCLKPSDTNCDIHTTQSTCTNAQNCLWDSKNNGKCINNCGLSVITSEFSPTKEQCELIKECSSKAYIEETYPNIKTECSKYK